MMNAHVRVRRASRGVAAIWVALSLLVLIGFIGLSIDTAYVLLVSHQLQNAADASALAGAQKVRVDTITTVRLLAQDMGQRNTAAGKAVVLDPNWDNVDTGDIIVGQYNRQSQLFTPTETGADAVKVTVHDNAVPLLFGTLFGVDKASITRSAVAMNVVSPGAGILVLNDDPDQTNPFQIKGSGALTLNDGVIQINSHYEEDLSDGRPDVFCSDINTCSSNTSAGGADFQGNLNLNQAPMPDPLMELRSWSPPTTPTQTPPNKSTDLKPGYYTQNVKFTNGQVHMDPGIYVFTKGFEVTGNAGLTAENVLIYVQGGDLKLTGAGPVNISPINSSQLPYGAPARLTTVSVMQAPSNTTDATIRGGREFCVTGTAYFPCAKLDLAGNSIMVTNQIIADRLDITGTPSITVNYDGRHAGGGTVFLVQ